MSMFCRTVTTWVTQVIYNPVNTWVTQQSTQCAKFPWPLNWLCWLVTTVILVVVWIAQNILKPITTVICIVIAGFIGIVLLPFAAAIDAACHKCTALNWVNYWLIMTAQITFVSVSNSTSQPGYFDYAFTCNCKGGKKDIVVTAMNDADARKLAIAECKRIC